jgi:multidrug efflux system membrane fusion protein
MATSTARALPRLRIRRFARPSPAGVRTRILTVAAIGLCCGLANAHAQQGELPVVSVAKPIVRDIVEDDEFVGRFQAVDEVTVRSRVGGYLDDVHFRTAPR